MDEIIFKSVATAWGTCGLIWKTKADRDATLLRVLAAENEAAKVELVARALFPTAKRVNNSGGAGEPAWIWMVSDFLRDYYDSKRPPVDQFQIGLLDQILDWSECGEFQRQVLQATAKIAFGQRVSYGQLARRIGRPGAARAVGSALAKNPWPVIVPCHRVIGADGGMRGFSAPGAVAAKARMICMEEQRSGRGTNAMEPSSSARRQSGLFEQPAFVQAGFVIGQAASGLD